VSSLILHLSIVGYETVSVSLVIPKNEGSVLSVMMMIGNERVTVTLRISDKNLQECDARED
jgi:hypothetical protein